MDLSSSQILSNFKLFSKNDNPILNNYSNQSFSYKFTITFFIIIAIIFIYIYRTEIYSNIIMGYGDLNNLLGYLWLKTHLTKTGEIASTYVPNDFFKN